MNTSIIIPVWGKLAYTEQCIEALDAYTPEEHEVIIVNNGSDDGTREWVIEQMAKRSNWKFVDNQTNLGFPKAINQGIAVSEGDYICLLNNDVVVSHDWLKGLIACIESDKDIALVGPMTNYVSGPQLLVDEYIGYDSLLKYQEFARDYRRSFKGLYTAYWRIVGFCMLIRRKVIDEIGTFDERFSPGNFEDDDFCLRAVMSGYRNVICRDVFVHHHGSVSMVDVEYQKIFDANKEKYNEKWSWYPQTISACLIVKNEEGNIAKCLDNITPIVDEVIVVDTGSTDKTKEICATYPKVKVFDLEWPDDFSIVRNFADSKATSAWLLSIDADEVITGLEAYRGKLYPHCCYRIVTRNYTTCPTYANVTYNSAEYPDHEQGFGWFPSTKIRLYPKDKRLRWDNPVHEVVEESAYHIGTSIIEVTDVIVHHYGRMKDGYEEDRGERYYELLKKQWKAGKSELRSLEQLAVQAQGLRKYDEAMEFWKQVMELDPSGGLAPLNICHIHAERDEWDTAKEWAIKALILSPESRDCTQNMAVCAFKTGDIPLAEKLARRLLKENPQNPTGVGVINAIREKKRQEAA